jgi:alpha-amylase
MTPALGLDVAVDNRSDRTLDARLGIEFALTMDGGGGNPAAWYAIDDRRQRHDSAGDAHDTTTLGHGNDQLGVAIETVVEPAADAWWSPIETISNSESGFERVYQGSTLLLSWPVHIRPGARHTIRVENRVTLARDMTAEELAVTSSTT